MANDAPPARFPRIDLEHRANASTVRRSYRVSRAKRLRQSRLRRLLAPEFLLRLGLKPQTRVLYLKERVRCQDAERKGERGFQ
jgi:hypothetical protein